MAQDGEHLLKIRNRLFRMMRNGQASRGNGLQIPGVTAVACPTNGAVAQLKQSETQLLPILSTQLLWRGLWVDLSLQVEAPMWLPVQDRNSGV